MSNPFWDAYLCGLKFFLQAAERLDPEDVPGWKTMLYHATTHFGCKGYELADGINHDKSTISKWINSGVAPTRETRELATRWIIRHCRRQLAG